MTTNWTCPEVLERLNDYLDGALPPDARRGTELHLRTCPACGRAMDELRCTRRALGRLPRERMPDEMKYTLLDAFRSSRLPEA